MKRTIRKTLSMLLTAALILNMGIVPVFAAEGADPGTFAFSECHTAHDESCGYAEGGDEKSCNFIPSEDVEATPANAIAHVHDESCGYAPATQGAPCTHVCELCKVLDSGTSAEKECTCEPAIGASGVGHGEGCPLYTTPEQREREF